MADPLITTTQLEVLVQEEPGALAADPFALAILADLSDYARFLGGHDGLDGLLWVAADGDNVLTLTAPYDVRRAVLMAAVRTFKNPDSEKSTTVGPIGATILDEAALAWAFTETEKADIQGYHPGGGPDGIYVIHTTRGEDPLPVEEVLFVPDNQQVGMTPDKNAWPSWDFPLFAEGDPGSDWEG